MLQMKKIAVSAVTVVMAVSALPVTTFAAPHQNEWDQKSDGKWYYYDYYGKKVKYDSAPYYDTGTGTTKYYVLNSKGARVTSTGWYTTKYGMTSYYNKVKFTTKYYLKSDGSCTTGWKKIGKKYYYFYSDGKMAASTSVWSKDGTKLYVVGADGARITKKGWYQLTYKYLSSSSGKVISDKYWYFVKTDKTAATKIKKIGGKKYLFKDSGILVQNDWYSFRNKNDELEYYAADKNGKLLTKKGKNTINYKSVHEGTDYVETRNIKKVVYVTEGGKLHLGLKKIKGKYYYFGPQMYRQTYCTVDGVKYFFGKTGASTKVIKLDA